jgi:hypothetical protein
MFLLEASDPTHVVCLFPLRLRDLTYACSLSEFLPVFGASLSLSLSLDAHRGEIKTKETRMEGSPEAEIEMDGSKCAIVTRAFCK